MSNLTNQEIPNEKDFVHFPKEIRKMMLRNTVRDCIVAQHFSKITNYVLFQSFPTAVWLIGVNYYTIDDKLEKKMHDVLAKYSLEHCEDTNDEALDNMAKKVIKEWKKLILVFNLKTA
ncbi:hypothetical protein ACTS93_15280 [Empedobacter falsenii]